jgi:hypothetical protein
VGLLLASAAVAGGLDLLPLRRMVWLVMGRCVVPRMGGALVALRPIRLAAGLTLRRQHRRQGASQRQAGEKAQQPAAGAGGG